MSARSYAMLAAVIFLAVAVLQTLRALGMIQIEIVFGGTTIAPAMSWVVAAIAALFAFLGFRAAGR